MRGVSCLYHEAQLYCGTTQSQQSPFNRQYPNHWMNYQLIYWPSKLRHHERSVFHLSSKHLTKYLPLIKTWNLRAAESRVRDGRSQELCTDTVKAILYSAMNNPPGQQTAFQISLLRLFFLNSYITISPTFYVISCLPHTKPTLGMNTTLGKKASRWQSDSTIPYSNRLNKPPPWCQVTKAKV